MTWESLKNLANSKIVKSSYIWLVVVPLVARLLSEIDDVIILNIFGSSIRIATALPFSWQLLFFSACIFTVANIIYLVFCPDLAKKYTNFTEFEDHGKSRQQIHSALKKLAWDNGKPGVRKGYVKTLSSYFKFYNNQTKLSEEDLDRKSIALFDDVSDGAISGKNSNAFYFVLFIANEYNRPAIIASAICYSLGLFAIGIIALQNVCYVVNTLS